MPSFRELQTSKKTHKSTQNSFKQAKVPSNPIQIDASSIKAPEKNVENIQSWLPIPKGDSMYALAKKAEYLDKNLGQAKAYYKKAIQHQDRLESALKDLASLYHQEGKTAKACKLLDSNKEVFKDNQKSFNNLYSSLFKQITITGNCLNKSIKISGLSKDNTANDILNLFGNDDRIKDLAFNNELARYETNYYCIIKFNSHSSARKTLEKFSKWDKYKVEWVSIDGALAGDAHYAKQKIENYRKLHPIFDYKIFERDTEGYIYSLPLDCVQANINKGFVYENSVAQKFLGKNLFDEIFIN
jgi:hypothetical protein